MKRSPAFFLSKCLLLLALAVQPVPAAAAPMSLTPQAVTDGFTLTTFASGFASRSDGLGPLGMTFLPGGPTGTQVMVTDDQLGTIYLIPDVDNQSLPSPLPIVYGFNRTGGLATIGGHIYMTDPAGNRVVEMRADGSIQLPLAFLNNPVAIIPDPLNGHLLVSQYATSQIMEIDPTGIQAPKIDLAVIADGIDFDAAHNTLYAATGFNGSQSTGVEGYDLATAQPVFPFLPVPGFPDGIALGTGSLAGNLFVNTNLGDLYEVNLATRAEALIATIGSRGDLVTVDPNGSLLITQTDRVLRLTAPSGGGFDTGNPVPEPAPILLLAPALFALAASRCRRKQRIRLPDEAPCAVE